MRVVQENRFHSLLSYVQALLILLAISSHSSKTHLFMTLGLADFIVEMQVGSIQSEIKLSRVSVFTIITSTERSSLISEQIICIGTCH